jgi:hypothetical protein
MNRTSFHQARLRPLKGKAYLLPSAIKGSASVPLDGAVLFMDFERETMVQLGQALCVQDLSGCGNRGLGQGVAYTPDGKVGGALALEGGALQLPRPLLNKISEYTVTAWVYRAKEESRLDLYSEWHPGIVAEISLRGGNGRGYVWLHMWNRHTPGYWCPVAKSPPGSVSSDQWAFIAVTVRNAGQQEGTASVTVNGCCFDLPIQGIDNANLGFATVGGDKGQIIDEMAIFPRALSDEKIKALYELGKSGRSLISEEAIFHP